MKWQSRYSPVDPLVWKGRPDIPDDSCFYQRIKIIDLVKKKPAPAQQVEFAILGFRCDEGIKRDSSREGASKGPEGIRKRLARLPVQLANIICYDVGDVFCEDNDLEGTQAALAEVVHELLKLNICPLV